jgi:hypothetical protein
MILEIYKVIYDEKQEQYMEKLKKFIANTKFTENKIMIIRNNNKRKYISKKFEKFCKNSINSVN